MTDWLITALGAFGLGFFASGMAYHWAHRRIVVWDYDTQTWRAAGTVMAERDHGHRRPR